MHRFIQELSDRIHEWVIEYLAQTIHLKTLIHSGTQQMTEFMSLSLNVDLFNNTDSLRKGHWDVILTSGWRGKRRFTPLSLYLVEIDRFIQK